MGNGRKLKIERGKGIARPISSGVCPLGAQKWAAVRCLPADRTYVFGQICVSSARGVGLNFAYLQLFLPLVLDAQKWAAAA